MKNTLCMTEVSELQVYCTGMKLHCISFTIIECIIASSTAVNLFHNHPDWKNFLTVSLPIPQLLLKTLNVS